MNLNDIKPYFDAYDVKQPDGSVQVEYLVKPNLEFRICDDVCEEFTMTDTHVTFKLNNDDDWVLPIDADFDHTASLIAI